MSVFSLPNPNLLITLFLILYYVKTFSDTTDQYFSMGGNKYITCPELETFFSFAIV